MLEMHLAAYKRGNVGYFIEELTNEQFISYEELSTLAGVSYGVLHNEGSGWLRFDYEGTELIVSKKSIRHSISWDHLNLKNVVYGNTVIDILGEQYKVRLLTGADTDPSVNLNGNYVEGTHNSEWSRLFYPLVNDDLGLPFEIRNPNAPYTNSQLGMVIGDGGSSWCQEVHPGLDDGRVLRGLDSASYFGRASSSHASTFRGWRPVLELIPPTLIKPNLIDGFVVNTSGQYLTSPENINGFDFMKND